ncbi:unnamed protein product [Calypogeia fissa]
MSVNLGLCVGAGSGCRAVDLWRDFLVFRLARKGFTRSRRTMGRSGVVEILAGNRASVHCDNLHEWRFWPLQQRQSSFLEVVGLQDRSCAAALGGRRMAKFSGCVPIARSPPNSVWPFSTHRSEESPRITKSIHQDRPMDEANPPPLFMGRQLKRFSHFRDGIVHWCNYLDVKTDIRNYGQKVSVREERCSSLGTQIVEDSSADDIDTNSSNITVICFDIETTGFSPNDDRIIEFAARDLAGGVCSTIETLVNPEREVRNENIHHISSFMVNNAGVPKWKDVALALVDFVESRRKGQGQVILVAHNGRRFDVPFIMSEFHACRVSMPSYWRFVDSMALAKLAMKGSGKSPSPKTALGHLFTYYNLPSVGKAHRAMADVNMLAQVLQMLMTDLEMSAEDLLEQSFSADEIILKGKDSKKSILNSWEVLGKSKLDSKKRVDNGNDSGSVSVPWDLITADSTDRGNEDEFETKLGVRFGQVWNSPNQQFSKQDDGPPFQIPNLGGLESGPNKKIIVQRIRGAGPAPLMHNPPRVVRTPAARPKKVDVQRDITT